MNYRPLAGDEDGVTLLDLNPESKHFGTNVQRKVIGDGVLPHHLYFKNNECRLCTTALGGLRLYELILDKGRNGTSMRSTLMLTCRSPVIVEAGKRLVPSSHPD